MKPTEYRKDGWPLCPTCGQDELAVLETPPPPNYTEPISWYLQREMFCYWCQRATVMPGDVPLAGAVDAVREAMWQGHTEPQGSDS